MVTKLTVLDEARKRAEACGLDDPICLYCSDFESGEHDVGYCSLYRSRQIQWGTCAQRWRWNGEDAKDA